MPELTREKISLGEMRASGVRGLLIRKFLQRSISGRIGSKGQRYVRLVAAAACGCVSDVFWGTAMLISLQFMASF